MSQHEELVTHEHGEVLRMKRTRVLFMVIAVTAAMLVSPILPAMATSSENSLVLYPYGSGATYSCTGGPPFVVDPHSSEGNCALEQIGAPPADVICDAPITIAFVHDMHKEVEDGMLCQ
jgi:hypothetical protein